MGTGRQKQPKPSEYYKFEALSRLEREGGKWKHKFTNRNGKKETDSTANLAYSMLISPAFKDLTARQRMLYLYAKAQFYSARSRPRDDFKEIPEFKEWEGRKYFYLNQRLMCDIYGLYTKGNTNLYKDIAALISHGFIERYTQGGRTGKGGNHMRSIYTYSEKWKEWEQGIDFTS